jgi:hypothetical protein
VRSALHIRIGRFQSLRDIYRGRSACQLLHPRQAHDELTALVQIIPT